MSKFCGSPESIIEKADEIVAICITNNDFLLLPPRQLQGILAEQQLAQTSAVQRFVKPKGDNFTKRYMTEIQFRQNGKFQTFNVVYSQKNQTQKYPLRASTINNEITKISQIIINALERNSKEKISKIELLFTEDERKKLYFTGTSYCEISHSRNSRSKSTSQFDSMFLDQTSVARSRRDLSTHLYRSRNDRNLDSSLSKISSYVSISSQRKACQGEFCNYIIKTHSNEGNNQIDYDDILNKVKLVYSGKGNQEINKMKLSIAVDYLQREKDKVRPKDAYYFVPYRFILIGRQFLQKILQDYQEDGLFEIDISSITGSQSILQLLEQTSLDIRTDPLIKPTRLYSSIKVCERCYSIYSTFRIILNTQRKGNLPPIQQAKRDFTPQENYISPIGIINKSNLQDMLVDIRHAINDLDNPQLSTNLRKRFDKMHKVQTEDYQKRQEEKRILIEKERLETIIPTKIDDIDLEHELASKYFPNEYIRDLKIKTQGGYQSWKQLLNKIRQGKSFKRKQLVM